jgi:hypothetical protein
MHRASPIYFYADVLVEESPDGEPAVAGPPVENPSEMRAMLLR